MRKNTTIDVDKRRTRIIKCIADGITSRTAIHEIIKKEFNVKTSQIDKDLRIAKDLIKDEFLEERDQEIAEAVFRLKRLIGMNMQLKDFREARQTQKDLSELLGLNAPTKVAQTDTKGEDLPIEKPIALEDLLNEIKNNRAKS